MVPQPFINFGQPTPPIQGHVCSQQNVPDPATRIQIKKRRAMGREKNDQCQNQGNQRNKNQQTINNARGNQNTINQGQGYNPQPKQRNNPQLCKNHPCTICGVYGNYTHDCLLLLNRFE
jgi:hypothetical protein